MSKCGLQCYWEKLTVWNNSDLAFFIPIGAGHLSWYIAKKQNGTIQISREIDMKWDQVFSWIGCELNLGWIDSITVFHYPKIAF